MCSSNSLSFRSVLEASARPCLWHWKLSGLADYRQRTISHNDKSYHWVTFLVTTCERQNKKKSEILFLLCSRWLQNSVNMGKMGTLLMCNRSKANCLVGLKVVPKKCFLFFLQKDARPTLSTARVKKHGGLWLITPKWVAGLFEEWIATNASLNSTVLLFFFCHLTEYS